MDSAIRGVFVRDQAPDQTPGLQLLAKGMCFLIFQRSLKSKTLGDLVRHSFLGQYTSQISFREPLLVRSNLRLHQSTAVAACLLSVVIELLQQDFARFQN